MIFEIKELWFLLIVINTVIIFSTYSFFGQCLLCGDCKGKKLILPLVILIMIILDIVLVMRG